MANPLNHQNQMFDQESADEQMSNAFSKTSEIVKNIQLPSADNHERKQTVTYTLRPSVKEGIENLSKQQGYKSTSAFVDELLGQILTK
ncbi:hypothetical protein [Leuconostoc pseudomesenteroides]|uniref:hypothetical protein n=1 Tax=Leuconostoc pseudomesenteroides TaxID=33968 RepID=UPI0039ECDE54